jgi:hypothetical protein
MNILKITQLQGKYCFYVGSSKHIVCLVFRLLYFHCFFIYLNLVPKVVMPRGDTRDKRPVSGKCSLWHA